MVKKIVWSNKALSDRYSIYLNWLQHNQSNAFSERLEKLFNEASELIARFPEIGSPTDFKSVP